MAFSVYAHHRDATSQATVTLEEIVDDIRSDRFLDSVKAIRFLLESGDADAAGEHKRRLNAVTFGGVFSHRDMTGCVKYSGMVIVDIDHLDGTQQAEEVRDAFRGRAVAAFVSPSGCGVKVLFSHTATDPEHHRHAWVAATNAVRSVCPEVEESQIDKSGKDVCRLCFLSHDTGAWIDPDAPRLEVDTTAQLEKEIDQPSVDGDGKVRVNRHQWLMACAGKLMHDLGNTLTDEAIIGVLAAEWKRVVVGRDPQPGEIDNAVRGARRKGYAVVPSAQDIDHGGQVAAALLSRSVDTVDEEEDEPRDVVIRKSESYDSPMPSRLLNVPGLIGMLCAEINRRSVRRQPVLALGGAIAFCGALFGRKIEGPTAAWTNMACLGIGPSTGGKSTSGNVLVQILTACPHGRYILGPSDMTSEAALMDAMVSRPSLYWFADEFGEFLASGRSAMANPGKHSLKNSLLQLVGSNWAGKTWTKGYANGKFNKEVHAPCLSVWGVTVADNLWANMDALTATGGFLGRFLLFRPDTMDKPAPVVAHRGPFDQALIDEVDWWCQGGGLSAVALATMPSPRLVDAKPDAMEILTEFAARADAEEASLRHRYSVLWGRAYENAHKLALIYAASANRENPVICEDAARWGRDLAEWSVRSVLGYAMREISDGESERRVAMVLGWIRERSVDGWCRKSALANLARKLPGRLQELGQILDLLVEGRQIEVEAYRSGARTGHRFRVR